MESFKQGYRLQQDDLLLNFYARYYNVQPYVTCPYSPYWIRYDIGFIYSITNEFYPVGAVNRIPDELSTGIFRPNFIVGDDWDPGIYEIRWHYKDYENSILQEKIIEFEILSDGIMQSRLYMFNHVDLPANFTLI